MTTNQKQSAESKKGFQIFAASAHGKSVHSPIYLPRRMQIIQSFQDIIDGLLLLLQFFVQRFLQSFVLLRKMQLDLGHLSRYLLLYGIFLKFGLPHKFAGIEYDARIQTDFPNLFLKRADSTFDGGQIEQLLIIEHSFLSIFLAGKVRLANLHVFQFVYLLGKALQFPAHVALRFVVDELEVDHHDGGYFLHQTCEFVVAGVFGRILVLFPTLVQPVLEVRVLEETIHKTVIDNCILPLHLLPFQFYQFNLYFSNRSAHQDSAISKDSGGGMRISM